MKSMIFSNNETILTRINRNKARKAYEEGKEVLFIPVNCNPLSSYFNLGIWEQKSLEGQYDSFEKLYNAFTYYNCNSETGKYIAFYIKQ